MTTTNPQAWADLARAVQLAREYARGAGRAEQRGMETIEPITAPCLGCAGTGRKPCEYCERGAVRTGNEDYRCGDHDHDGRRDFDKAGRITWPLASDDCSECCGSGEAP